MSETLPFLVEYGYWILFASAFLEQTGLPFPALPVLLTMGALSHTGQFSFTAVLFVSVLGAMLGDLIWYQLGRRHGRSILDLICRISLEPAHCVRRAEDLFSRHGSRTLLFAKFIPGLNTVAVPLAGMLRMNIARFLAFDAGGTSLWAGVFSATGYAFSTQLEHVAGFVSRLGVWALLLLGVVFAVYLNSKYKRRHR